MNLNCDHVAELLPWYLNGTLDEGEQGEVRVHLEGCTQCRQALDETRLAWRIYDQHIPSEALVALAWGEDTPEGMDPEILERHLETCPACAAELEMARTSRRLEEDERIALFPTSAKPAMTEVKTAAKTEERTGRSAAPWWRTAAMAASLAGIVAASGWIWSAGRTNDLEERLAEAGRPPVATPVPAPAPDAGRVSEMTAEVERLQRREAELRQQQEEMQEQLARIAEARPAAPSPQINAWIGDLRPTQDVVRGGSAAAEELPAGRTASLILGTSHKETHRGHRVEILDSAGKVVWSADGLIPDGETNDYGITLPAGTLKPGAYTIRISAQEDGKQVDLESYAVRVR